MKTRALFACLLILLAHNVVGQSAESHPLFSVYSDGQCGYINRDGQLIIKQQFEQCWPFSEGLAGVVVNRKLGFINDTGDFVIKPQFDWHYTYFSEGLATISRSNDVTGVEWGYVDKIGRVFTVPSITYAFNFADGLAVVERKGLKGYINKEMQFVIYPTFSYAGEFVDGLALVCAANNPCYYINKLGQKVIDREGFQFSEGLAAIKVEGKYGFMDTAGRIVISPQFEDVAWFSGGLAAAKIKNKWGYIDKSGRIIIPPQFDKAGGFTPDGIASVMIDGKYGFIDKNGNIIIKLQFDGAEWLSDGIGVVELAGKSGYLDKTGRFVWLH